MSEPARRDCWVTRMVRAAVVAAVVLSCTAALPPRAAAVTYSWGALPGAAPPPRSNAAIAYDGASQQIVLFGGQAGASVLGDTWTWNGTAWSQQFPAASPPARAGARLAYDAVTHQLILFGGHEYASTARVGDTWAWTGSNWVMLNPAHSPPFTTDFSLAYDGRTGQLVLFGGQQLNDPRTGVLAINPSNQMWNWNGTDWTQLNPAKLPAARADAAMAYDSATSQLMLFGGMGAAAVGDFGDTWSWNGSSWTHLSPGPGPPARSGAGVSYDAAAKALVLEGGSSFDTTNGTLAPLRDTWAWNGSRWFVEPVAPGGDRGAMAFDARTGQLVLLPPDSTSTWLWTPLQVVTLVLPSVAVGSRYSATLQAIGGAAPYTWSVAVGALPAGLSLSSSGVISGTPTTAGKSTFTVEAVDAETKSPEVAKTTLQLTVNPAPPAGVWVSNGGYSGLSEFALSAAGNVPPEATLAGGLTGLNGPDALAFDQLDDLYVANSGAPSVTEYSAGARDNATPLRTIEGPLTGLTTPAGIAVDQAGRLWVTNEAAQTVTVYPPGASGNASPIQTIQGPDTGLAQPWGITIDANGHVWVANYASSILTEYTADANGDASPLATIGGPNTQLDQPEGLGQDARGDLLAANISGHVVTGYSNAPPYGDVTPQVVLSGLTKPDGVDVDAANRFYVSDQSGALNIYGPSNNPSAAFGVTVVGGSATGMSAPDAVAVVPPLRITTRSAPTATLGDRYAARLYALAGTPPLHWRITQGRPPRGLQLSRSGLLSGVPRRLGRASFTVVARDSTRRAMKATAHVHILVTKRPTVTTVRPRRARAGQRVAITGSMFSRARGATTISFGRIRALRVRCTSRTRCTATAPPHAAGSVAVSVTVADLTSKPTNRGRFTYR